MLDDKSLINLLICDTVGQELFRLITRIFYKGSLAIMIVFDITRGEFFDKDWQKVIDLNSD